jgi:hypothetical protein
MRNLNLMFLLAAVPGLARAQFNTPKLPQGGSVTSVPTTPAQQYTAPNYGGVRPAYVNPGYYYGGGPVVVQDPISGYYNGVANVTAAMGQYGIDYQQSRLMQEDIERSKIQTRKQLIEQKMWEESIKPKSEDIRMQKMELDLRRALNAPPLSDIISGSALNILLQNIQDVQAKGGYGPVIPLDQETLDHLNLSATPDANIALFKNGGKLKWPFVLRDTPFDANRTQMQDLVNRALKEVQDDELTPATVRGMKNTLAAFDKDLDKMAPEMSIADSIQARRYVDELKSSVKALEHPNANNYLTKKWSPQGRSVGDLVAYMTKNGLRYAPALQGEEGPYRAMHQGLVGYTMGAMQSVRR